MDPNATWAALVDGDASTVERAVAGMQLLVWLANWGSPPTRVTRGEAVTAAEIAITDALDELEELM